jgi:hypothetical protein
MSTGMPIGAQDAEQSVHASGVVEMQHRDRCSTIKAAGTSRSVITERCGAGRSCGTYPLGPTAQGLRQQAAHRAADTRPTVA